MVVAMAMGFLRGSRLRLVYGKSCAWFPQRTLTVIKRNARRWPLFGRFGLIVQVPRAWQKALKIHLVHDNSVDESISRSFGVTLLSAAARSGRTMLPQAHVGKLKMEFVKWERMGRYCGESLGGLLGMAFAAQYPHRVRTLTLIGAPPYISEHDNKTTTFGFSSRIEALEKMGSKAWAQASNTGRRFPPDAYPRMSRWFADELLHFAVQHDGVASQMIS